MGEDGTENARVALLVPRSQVKKVKSALEARSVLDRTRKISAENASDPGTEPRMIIHTTIPFAPNDHGNGENHEHGSHIETILAGLGLQDIQDAITLSPFIPRQMDTTRTSNPLLKGLKTALYDLPEELLVSLNLSVGTLILSFPDSYSIYKPMLLLPPNAFNSTPWTKLLSSHPMNSPLLQSVWKKLAAAVGATHVAINAGIPLQSVTEEAEQENILRSPSNLTPLYGNFGPNPSPQTLTSPTASDFASALWVAHTQNGIHQTWAPLYTMFSRGNIREKTRLLTLPSVLSSVSDGKGKQKASSASSPQGAIPADGCTAVDLYAGIGYFAFPYKRAGISKILCWELNPWSIEGLRRGAEQNKWTTQTFTTLPSTNSEWSTWAQSIQNVDFLIFHQSNEDALDPVMVLKGEAGGVSSPREMIPPIRHVNCGFLPSSKTSWPRAVKMIDRELGGWIHAHENVGINDIDTRKEVVVAEMQHHLDSWEAERTRSYGSYRRRVRCEHVERVKTYAPGVLHVVFDVCIGGMRDVDDLLT